MDRVVIEQDTSDYDSGIAVYNDKFLPAELTWNAQNVVPVTSMMEMNISGEVFGEITYDLYTSSGQIVYEGASEFTPPEEVGDYYLFAFVGWGEDGNYIIYQYYAPMSKTTTVKRAEDIEIVSLDPSTNGVEEFLETVGEIPTSYEEDTCFNVMPEEISENYGFDVFKFDLSAANMLLYEERVYMLGTWFGGLGIHNFAVADLNKDGANEMYFAFSFGSGIHRSQVGYFDSQTYTVSIFDYQNLEGDVVLGVQDGVLGVYSARTIESESFVDLKFEQSERLATLGVDDGVFILSVDR